MGQKHTVTKTEGKLEGTSTFAKKLVTLNQPAGFSVVSLMMGTSCRDAFVFWQQPLHSR